MIPVLVSKMQNRGLWLLLLLLSVAQQASAADPPVAVAAENSAGNQSVKELLDTYKDRESKIRSLEAQWEEDVVDGLQGGASSKYARKWRVLLAGDKVRTEESGAPGPGQTGTFDRFITAFNGTVGKRLGSSNIIGYALGNIDDKDGSEMLKVNNARLDCLLFSLLPSVVLSSREMFRTDWTNEIGQLDGQRVIVLSRNVGKPQFLVEKLYIDPASLLIKRATHESQNTMLQWDVEFRDIDGQAMPVKWKWNNTDRNGQLYFAATSRTVQVTLNPAIAPAEFELEFPVGAHVNDRRNGEAYIVGPTGEKMTDPVAASVAAQIKAAKVEADAKIKNLLGKPLVFAGATPQGKSISSAEYKGKVLLVHFWATWCISCIAELPHVREVYGKYHEKGLEVIGVSYDSEADALTKYVAENKMPWVQVLDKPDAHNQPTLTTRFTIPGSGAMFLIDKKGICRAIKDGKDMDELVPQLLAE